MNNSEFQAHTEQIDRLVQRVNEIADDDTRTTALELLQSVMDLHGAAWSRVIEVLSDAGESGRNSLAKLGSDPLLSGLLVLYGIHPLSELERVRRALDQLGPQLRKKSASVELIDVEDTLVRVKAEAVDNGCGASPDEIKQMIEQSVLEAAPEVTEIVVEGLASSTNGFVPLNRIQPAIKEERRYEESAA